MLGFMKRFRSISSSNVTNISVVLIAYKISGHYVKVSIVEQ